VSIEPAQEGSPELATLAGSQVGRWPGHRAPA
jgi:hypothetical protein